MFDLTHLPFRLGTTSYIIPADVLPNLRWLEGKVRDVELVYFETDDYCNLPTPAEIAQMREFDLSYNVHLPLNLNFSHSESIEKALKVTRACAGLGEVPYVCHVSGGAKGVSAFLKESGIAPRRLCVENLESYPIEENLPIIQACDCAACLDIGHLWLQGRDPLPILREWLPLTRVIHLHGIGTRDHQSLRHQPIAAVRAVWEELLRFGYQGRVTLEVFSENDFRESMAVLEEVSHG